MLENMHYVDRTTSNSIFDWNCFWPPQHQFTRNICVWIWKHLIHDCTTVIDSIAITVAMGDSDNRNDNDNGNDNILWQ